MHDREALIDLIATHWPDASVARTEGAVFFSLDASNWPNFATIVWTDAFDMGNPSDLARGGVYRLNIGSGRRASSGWSAACRTRTTGRWAG